MNFDSFTISFLYSFGVRNDNRSTMSVLNDIKTKYVYVVIFFTLIQQGLDERISGSYL